MQNRRNFYRVLHVQPDAPAETIAASYRTLMKRLRMHPDLGGDHWNAVLINEAFATLKDPVKRRAYDQTLATPDGRRRAGVDADTGAEPGGDTAPNPTSSTAMVSAGTVSVPVSCAFCQTLHSARATLRPDALCSCCRSPLFAVDRKQVVVEDAAVRALERIDRHCPVNLYVTWPQNAPIAAASEDASIHGMSLVVRTELRVGERVKIECEFCDAVAEVTRVDRSPSGLGTEWHAGIQFLTFRARRLRGGLVSVDA